MMALRMSWQRFPKQSLYWETLKIQNFPENYDYEKRYGMTLVITANMNMCVIGQAFLLVFFVPESNPLGKYTEIYWKEIRKYFFLSNDTIYKEIEYVEAYVKYSRGTWVA